jgi:post-segregation antitoxin (ccd killing protein)
MNKFLGADPAPQSAKANRQRLFAERPTILDEEANRANAVRVNMARLREMRLAKEAQEVRTEISTANQPPKAKSKRR